MVTKEQFVTGIMTYAEKEVIPHLSTAGKWGVGTFIVLMTAKTQTIINELTSNELIRMLDIVDENGLIDEVRLSKALVQSAERYGKLQVNIPVLGTLTFNSQDIEMLTLYIDGGSHNE